MSGEKRKVLEMLEAGQITQEDAQRLLDALGESGEEPLRGPEKEIPTLTLFPEEDMDRLDEAVSKTVEETIDKAMADGAELAPLPTGGTPYPCPETGAQKIRSVEIGWVAGPVEIRRGQEDQLKVTEYASRPLKEEERLEFSLEDGELKIKWRKETLRSLVQNPFQHLAKHLVVELPCSLQKLDELQVNNVSGALRVDAQGLTVDDASLSTVSGELYAVRLQGDDVSLSTVSGALDAQDVSGDDLSFTSVSGRVGVRGFRGDDVSLSTVSGKIEGFGRGDDVSANSTSGGVAIFLETLPGDFSGSTVSGRVSLTLPDDPKGFTVHYDTMSGKLSSDFPLSGSLGKKSGEGHYAGGEADISFHSLSGGMELHRG